jgi:hypothetical protein
MLLTLTDSALPSITLSEQPSLLELSEQPVTFCVEALLCLPQHCFLFTTASPLLSFLSSFLSLRRTIIMKKEGKGKGKGKGKKLFLIHHNS